MKVSIAQFADVISKELSEFREEKIDNMKKIIDDVAKETTSDLKQTSPKRTGEYAKHWANKTVAESALKKNKVVYNRNPTYRVAHLLEKGHVMRRGGRTFAHSPAIPHIEPAYEKADKEIERRIKQI